MTATSPSTAAAAETGRTAQHERAIQDLIVRWGYARDGDDWATLEDCFHADAHIHISWISDSAVEFVKRSCEMAAARGPGSHMEHVISNSWIAVRNERAFCRTNVLLLIRDRVDGHWCDLESHIRFFDRIEWRDGQWRIVERTGVYDKDRVDFLDGTGAPEAPPLPDIPSAAHYLCAWLGAKGQQPVANLISMYSDEETRLLQDCEAWLAADSAAAV